MSKNAIKTYRFTLTSDIYHEATKRNKTANIYIIETKHKGGYFYEFGL